MLNQLLGGHYQVIQALGEGGMAQTYIAEDHYRPGHPKCAVKFLKPASKDPNFLPTARRLFNKEAEILEKLGQHSRIPRLLAYFEEDREFFIIQEFIEGRVLNTELPPNHRWTESKVVLMLQDVLQTLEFVHSYGVIHRDIKPNNLIRRQKDSRLVLIDFGAVKQIRDPGIINNTLHTKKTISIGTQGYVPTEQVRGKPRLNSDIYALGMIGIQALTGVDPLHLQEDADGEVIWQNRAEVSDRLAAILTKMVRYHFKERYQSATEVLQELQPLSDRHSLVRATLDISQPSIAVAPQSKLRETKVSLGSVSPDATPVAKLEPRETKMPLGVDRPDRVAASKIESPKKAEVVSSNNLQNSQVTPEPKSRETKVCLGNVPPEATPVPKPEPRETKVALGIDRPDRVAVAKTESKKVEVNSDNNLQSSKLVSNQKKKVSSLSSAVSPARAEDIFSHFTNFLALKPSRLLIGAGVISVLISIFAGYNYTTHKHSNTQTTKSLEQIEALKTAKKYKECVQQAQKFPKDRSNLYAEVETLLYECQQAQAKEHLGEAKKLAEQSKFKDAIVLALQVPKDTSLYSEAQQLTTEWSETIFQIASNKYQEGNLQEANAIASAIPTNSSMAKKAQSAIKKWNQEWKKNELHLQAAQKGLDEHRWQDAINIANKVSNNAYWQIESELVIEKAKAGIAAAKPAHTTIRPGVTDFKNLYIEPSHPINDPNRDWVKERLGR